MSKEEITSKLKKSSEVQNKTSKNKEKNSSKQKNQNQKSKEKEINSLLKEKNEMSSKDREYLGILENLTLKVKIMEQNTKNEENKLLSTNTEKENRLQMLTSSNQKIKQTLNILTEKIEQIKTNMEKNKKENSQNKNDNDNKNETKSENNKDNYLSKQDQDIKSKQKLINILSNENRTLKKTIDHYYELNTKNKLYGEIKQKENTKKKMEKEIKNYEEIMNKHYSECTNKIKKLEKEYDSIKKKLDQQNIEYHSKNKDYIYLQSKFSLQKKEDEIFYNELKDKQNFLDMNKHPYLMNLENKKTENIKINLTKKKEFSRDIENGLINKYEIISLPKIDINHEGKIISSIFTEEEMEQIKQQYNDEEKFETFKEKIIELERGGIVDMSNEELIEECSKLQKEIQDKEENVFVEKHRLKNMDLEINKNKNDYRNVLRKNIKLKKEEKNLKERLEMMKYKYGMLLRKQKGNNEMNNIIDGINDIVSGRKKNKNKTKEENNELINNSNNDKPKKNFNEEKKGNEGNGNKQLEEEGIGEEQNGEEFEEQNEEFEDN